MEENVYKLFDPMGHNEIVVPKYGWKVTMDWVPPVKCKPFRRPRLHQINGFIMPAIRYLYHVYRPARKEGRLPFIDSLNPVSWSPIYGVPMGGIGCGVIGRGYRGEFCRSSLVPGIYDYHVSPASQFIVTVVRRGVTVYQQVLSPLGPPVTGPGEEPGLGKWSWQFPAARAAYIGLYPRAWTVFSVSEHRLKIYCRQVSPVMPHDYKDSCLPLAMFEWRVLNLGPEELGVSITLVLSASGLLGSEEPETAGITDDSVAYMRTKLGSGMPCCLGVAPDGTGGSVTVVRGDYGRLWEQLMRNPGAGLVGGEAGPVLGVAVSCYEASVEGGGGLGPRMRMAVCWHMPRVWFRDRTVEYTRRYARWFDSNDLVNGANQLLRHGLKHMDQWETVIEKWQSPLLDNEKVPAWFKSALFNELYYVADGGTVWLDVAGDHPVSMATVPGLETRPGSGPAGEVTEDDRAAYEARIRHRHDYGTFAYLEGHEYRMYNTYDVHHYSSWALVRLWPRLQESIQLDVADCAHRQDSTATVYIHRGSVETRSAAHAVPHDLGDPEAEPYLAVNAYVMYNTDLWKDLNPKFVLQVYRDWRLLRNRVLLQYLFPVVSEVIKVCLAWDRDGDGCIENSGYADQTYDAWTAQGVSAYTGGLWLGSVHAACEMARELGRDSSFLASLLEKGRASYEAKLWTGEYYRYDERCSSIMSDQLCGQWYLGNSRHGDEATPDPEATTPVFRPQHVQKALCKMYDTNCRRHGNAKNRIAAPYRAAVNGCLSTGSKDISSVQSEEYWVGVNYALASVMILEGLAEQGWSVAESMYRTVYEQYGLQYQTPEAIFDDGRYRSPGYMRPLSIWSIYHSLVLTGVVSEDPPQA